MSLVQSVWNQKWVFRNILQTIYFNFHYLPFSQAIKLPIWLYKPRFGKLNGTLKIEALGGVKTGMIRMGYFNVGIYPNNGIYFSNEGSIVFKGNAYIGNDVYIGVGEKSSVFFGHDFRATTTFRLTSFCGVEFADYVRFGWDCIVMDTDFHRLTRIDGSQTKGYGKIKIGSYNWIGNGCRIMKNTETPDYCTIAAGTILGKRIDCPSYSVIGTRREITTISEGMWLDPRNNNVKL